MLPLQPALSNKLQAGYQRSIENRLTVAAIYVGNDGGCYKVTSATSSHYVYVCKVDGVPTFHCDCQAHAKGLVCRCGSVALWEYKNWLRANSPACLECQVMPITLANTDLCNNCIAEVA